MYTYMVLNKWSSVCKSTEIKNHKYYFDDVCKCILGDIFLCKSKEYLFMDPRPDDPVSSQTSCNIV